MRRDDIVGVARQRKLVEIAETERMPKNRFPER
jgi:hypothetical protein